MATEPTTMDVVTNITMNATEEPRQKPNILELRLATWIYLVISVYLTISLTVELKKTVFSKIRKILQGDRNSYGTVLNFSRLFAAYFTSLVFIYSSFSTKIEEISGIDCDWFKKSEIFLYWLNISVIYAVLWLRQRAIYGKPTLRHLTTKVTVVISNAVGVLIILLPIVNGIITAITITFAHYGNEVCAFHNYTYGDGDEDVIAVCEFIVPLALPLSLMGLFIWPLLRHHMSGELESAGKTVMFLVRKIVLLTLGCLITDMGAMACNKVCDVFQSFTGRQTSVFVNFLLLTFAFSDWKRVIVPCMKEKNPRKNKGTVVRPTWTAATYTTSSGGTSPCLVRKKSKLGSPNTIRPNLDPKNSDKATEDDFLTIPGLTNFNRAV